MKNTVLSLFSQGVKILFNPIFLVKSYFVLFFWEMSYFILFIGHFAFNFVFIVFLSPLFHARTFHEIFKPHFTQHQNTFCTYRAGIYSTTTSCAITSCPLWYGCQHCCCYCWHQHCGQKLTSELSAWISRDQTSNFLDSFGILFFLLGFFGIFKRFLN